MKPRFLRFYSGQLRGLGLLLALLMFVLAAVLPTRAQQDTTPPVLVSLEFSPAQIDTTAGPASVTLTVHFTDDLAGFYSGSASFRSPSGNHSYNLFISSDNPYLISGTKLDGTSQFTGDWPQFSEPGTWTLSEVYVSDRIGNYRYYYASELQAMGISTTTLEVTSQQDVTPPVLVSLEYSPAQIDTTAGPASVTLTAHFTDDLAGFYSGSASFRSPSGDHSFPLFMSSDNPYLISGTKLDGTSQFTGDWPQFSEPGTWTLSEVYVSDRIGNYRYYYISELQAMGFPTTLINGPNKSSTIVAVNSSINPSAFNQPILLSATVTSSAGTPTGTVDFTADGGISLGSSALGGTGIATISVSSLAAAPHSITATYGGDASYASSSGVLAQTVKQATTSLSLASSLLLSSFHQPVTFTATITRQFGGEATGSVAFYADGSPLGTATVSGNTASFVTTELGVGTHSISAVYSGDSNFLSSMRTLTQKVKKATTTTALVSSQNPSFIGQAVTLTATVTPAFGGVPTGTVTFKTGTTVLSTVAVAGDIASYTTDSLALGYTSITAAYSGDTNFGTSSKSLSQKVNKFATATALNSDLNPSVFGQAVTLTATVSSSGPTLSGNVEFRAGTTVLGTRTLAGGTATFTTSALNVGTFSMKAVYSGDASSAASTSPVVSQKVTKAATTVSLVSSLNPSAIGQSVTFTATVSSTAGTPAGTVTFKAGTKVLGTKALSNGTAAVTASFSAAKPQTITATYSGAANYFGNSATITQMVQ